MVERGVFDEETVPEELTQVRMGKIVQGQVPRALDPDDQEAVRQHAVAALEPRAEGEEAVAGGGSGDGEGGEAPPTRP